MRVFQTITAFLFSSGLIVNAHAQIIKTVTDAGNTVNETNNALAGTSAAVNNTKNTIGTIFGSGKAKEATVFVISGIEYGNEDLELLKNYIKNTKGVKDLVTNFKDGTITITFKSKDNATELWDKIPQSEKAKFKLTQSDKATVMMEYKASNINTGTTATATPETVSLPANKSDLKASPDNNTPAKAANSKNSNAANSKSAYYVAYDFNGKGVHLESEILNKESCSAIVGPTGKTLTLNIFNKETKTGLSFQIYDFETIKAKRYEFDSKKTNAREATWENGTNNRQMLVYVMPGDNKRYQIQCATDPVYNYQGSGYMNLLKYKAGKGGIIEGEFEFSFPMKKSKDAEEELLEVNSGTFRIAVIQ